MKPFPSILLTAFLLSVVTTNGESIVIAED